MNELPAVYDNYETWTFGQRVKVYESIVLESTKKIVPSVLRALSSSLTNTAVLCSQAHSYEAALEYLEMAIARVNVLTSRSNAASHVYAALAYLTSKPSYYDRGCLANLLSFSENIRNASQELTCLQCDQIWIEAANAN